MVVAPGRPDHPDPLRSRDGWTAVLLYHGGDWGQVTSTAVRLIAQVEAAGVTEDDEVRDQVMAAARAEALSRWARWALYSLLADPIVIPEATDKRPASFVNGQHRTRAMRDAGLTAVLVAVDEPAEPGTPTPS